MLLVISTDSCCKDIYTGYSPCQLYCS